MGWACGWGEEERDEREERREGGVIQEKIEI